MKRKEKKEREEESVLYILIRCNTVNTKIL